MLEWKSGSVSNNGSELRDNHRQKCDEAVAIHMTTTLRGQSNPLVIHQSAGTGHLLPHAVKELSDTMFIAIVLNGLPKKQVFCILEKERENKRGRKRERERERERERDDIEVDQHFAVSSKYASNSNQVVGRIFLSPRSRFTYNNPGTFSS